MRFPIIEYTIGSRLFYTCSAPCTVAHQKTGPFMLKECFQEFASELHKKGITHVVVLLTKRDMAFYYKGTLFSLYEAYGISVIHYPIIDFGIPKDMKSFIELQRKLLTLIETHILLIHCRGGIGRTGLVTAGLFITKGISPDKAIQMVRMKRTGSVETKEQEKFLIEYARLIGLSSQA